MKAKPEEATGRPAEEPEALDSTDGFAPGTAAGLGGDLEDLTVKDATDPDLGLTGIGDVPAQDWAADTGPARTGEAAAHGVDRRLADRDRAPSGRRIDFDKNNRK